MNLNELSNLRDTHLLESIDSTLFNTTHKVFFQFDELSYKLLTKRSPLWTQNTS